MNVIENINAVNSEKIKRWNRMETSEKLHEYKILKNLVNHKEKLPKIFLYLVQLYSHGLNIENP